MMVIPEAVTRSLNPCPVRGTGYRRTRPPGTGLPISGLVSSSSSESATRPATSVAVCASSEAIWSSVRKYARCALAVHLGRGPLLSRMTLDDGARRSHYLAVKHGLACRHFSKTFGGLAHILLQGARVNHGECCMPACRSAPGPPPNTPVSFVRKYGPSSSAARQGVTHMSQALVYTGVFPIAPTPFTESGDLDLPGMRRVLDCMIDQGVDGICILANYSEQFLLTDEERDTLLDLSLTQVAGRVPVIVTCSHFSTRIAAARARRAVDAGAQMLMLMPPYHGASLRAHEKGIVEHFAAVAAAAVAANGTPVSIMVQDAPLSGVSLPVPLLARLAHDLPQVRYFKIEVANAAAKLRALIEAGGKAIAGPFDGEESLTLMADLDAGATGTMPSALLPDLIGPVVRAHLAGNRAEAAALYARILPLINFENRQCGLRACKTVMMAGGVIKSDAVRHPQEAMHPATHAGLLELAREVGPLALHWGK